MEQNNPLENQQIFQQLSQNGNFSISSYENIADLMDNSKFVKLRITPAQKMQVNSFLQNVPEMLSSNALANAYVVKFPEGMPHTLTALKQGGFGSMIKGPDGKIMGHASFFQLSTQAAMLNAFTAMSVVTGQYFMSEINSELKMINCKMDRILEFLYGEKKAELASEINFIKYAYYNFSSIMEYDLQRIATISSLQEAKKVAMKDMEFYLSDLHSKTKTKAKNYDHLTQIIEDSIQSQQSIELSVQLYVMSGLLEMQYAQNTDEHFMQNLQNEMNAYLDKYKNNILYEFGQLQRTLDDYKPGPIEKVHKSENRRKIDNVIGQLRDGEKLPIQKKLDFSFDSIKKGNTYYIGQDGNIYIQRAG